MKRSKREREGVLRHTRHAVYKLAVPTHVAVSEMNLHHRLLLSSLPCTPLFEMRKKRPHQKSRNGCDACRLRRVKCDEVSPVCGSCAVRDDVCHFTRPNKTLTKSKRASSAPHHLHNEGSHDKCTCLSRVFVCVSAHEIRHLVVGPVYQGSIDKHLENTFSAIFSSGRSLSLTMLASLQAYSITAMERWR